jgi:hypothetical protein
LHPIQHRSEEVRLVLVLLRARAALAARTELITALGGCCATRIVTIKESHAGNVSYNQIDIKGLEHAYEQE